MLDPKVRLIIIISLIKFKKVFFTSPVDLHTLLHISPIFSFLTNLLLFLLSCFTLLIHLFSTRFSILFGKNG